jgi:hypothetical protein
VLCDPIADVLRCSLCAGRLVAHLIVQVWAVDTGSELLSTLYAQDGCDVPAHLASSGLQEVKQHEAGQAVLCISYVMAWHQDVLADMT